MHTFDLETDVEWPSVAIYTCGPQTQKSSNVFRHFGDILARKSSAMMANVMILFIDTKKSTQTTEPCVF